ncbi:MAG: type VI secretion system contractile sheath large subunit [Maricaulaceae bacterium]
MAGADSAGVAGPLPLRSEVWRRAGADPEGRLDAFLAEPSPARALADWFGSERVAEPGVHRRAALDRDIAALDAAIAEIVDRILHHEAFQRLEALWRGVYWLTGLARGEAKLRIKLLNVSWQTLVRDMERAADFERSALFTLLYHREFGMPGGEPFGLLVGDYAIRHAPRPGGVDDVAALRELAKIGASAFCPMVFNVDPVVFGVDTMAELGRRENLSATFQQTEYTRLRSFQNGEESRYVGLVAGRLLIRTPREGRAAGDLGWLYQERADRGAHLLWAPGAFAVAYTALRAYEDYRWVAAIRGAPEDEIAGGVLDGLPVADFATDRPGAAVRFGVEANLSERQEAALNGLGFMVLRPCPYTPYLALFAAPSLQKPRTYRDPAVTLNAKMSAMLQYMLCVCRFAHYVKVIVRDWVGAYKTAQDMEMRLQRWIETYCLADDEASYEERARYPLRTALVEVGEVDGAPGKFNCVMFFQPHFQFDNMVTEFQLRTEFMEAA